MIPFFFFLNFYNEHVSVGAVCNYLVMFSVLIKCILIKLQLPYHVLLSWFAWPCGSTILLRLPPGVCITEVKVLLICGEIRTERYKQK